MVEHFIPIDFRCIYDDQCPQIAPLALLFSRRAHQLSSNWNANISLGQKEEILDNGDSQRHFCRTFHPSQIVQRWKAMRRASNLTVQSQMIYFGSPHCGQKAAPTTTITGMNAQDFAQDIHSSSIERSKPSFGKLVIGPLVRRTCQPSYPL